MVAAHRVHQPHRVCVLLNGAHMKCFHLAKLGDVDLASRLLHLAGAEVFGRCYMLGERLVTVKAAPHPRLSAVHRLMLDRGRSRIADLNRRANMWTCRSCGLEIMFRAVEPEIDGDGCFFLCPGCNHRNALVNVGGKSGDIALAQSAE